jgi:hypothetical protein
MQAIANQILAERHFAGRGRPPPKNAQLCRSRRLKRRLRLIVGMRPGTVNRRRTRSLGSCWPRLTRRRHRLPIGLTLAALCPRLLRRFFLVSVQQRRTRRRLWLRLELFCWQLRQHDGRGIPVESLSVQNLATMARAEDLSSSSKSSSIRSRSSSAE